jgi:hypothetical protein
MRNGRRSIHRVQADTVAFGIVDDGKEADFRRNFRLALQDGW